MRQKRCVGCRKKLKDNKWCMNTECKFGKIHAEILKIQEGVNNATDRDTE